MASSTSNEHVEGAGLTARPKRAGVPSAKVRSADNAAEPALSSHRTAQAALAIPCPIPLASAPTSVPNTPSASGSHTLSGSAATATSTGLGTGTPDDVTDDDRVEVLAGMTRRCK
jgi:hypothetical protein